MAVESNITLTVVGQDLPYSNNIKNIVLSIDTFEYSFSKNLNIYEAPII